MNGKQAKRLRKNAKTLAMGFNVSQAVSERAMKSQFNHQASIGINKRKNIHGANIAMKIIYHINKKNEL